MYKAVISYRVYHRESIFIQIRILKKKPKKPPTNQLFLIL